MSYQVIARKWRPQTFDEVTGQEPITRTLRNAIEHGIETPAQRRASGKNPRGTLLVEFQPRLGAQSELNFQDDGAGLNAERIVQVAVSSGLIAEDSSLEQNRRQASALIFHSGLSTAAEPAGRGLGMRILRDNVKRLHGQIQVATKRGLFTRLRIRLPLTAMGAIPSSAARSPLRGAQRIDSECPSAVGNGELLSTLGPTQQRHFLGQQLSVNGLLRLREPP